MTAAKDHRRYPYLWQHNGENEVSPEGTFETVDDLMKRFSSTPPPRSLWRLVQSCLAVGQEFALTSLLLALHRFAIMNESDSDRLRQVVSISVVSMTLLALIWYSERAGTFRSRACDAVLLAAILRLLSSVLRTLTASYSSDTVYALAISGMLVHLLSCDYRYANGMAGNEKAAFAGGVMSLNASLFATTLLASRLSFNATVYLFVSTSVVLFAFYPRARHMISATHRRASIGTFIRK